MILKLKKKKTKFTYHSSTWTIDVFENCHQNSHNALLLFFYFLKIKQKEEVVFFCLNLKIVM